MESVFGSQIIWVTIKQVHYFLSINNTFLCKYMCKNNGKKMLCHIDFYKQKINISLLIQRPGCVRLILECVLCNLYDSYF